MEAIFEDLFLLILVLFRPKKKVFIENLYDVKL